MRLLSASLTRSSRTNSLWSEILWEEGGGGGQRPSTVRGALLESHESPGRTTPPAGVTACRPGMEPNRKSDARPTKILKVKGTGNVQEVEKKKNPRFCERTRRRVRWRERASRRGSGGSCQENCGATSKNHIYKQNSSFRCDVSPGLPAWGRGSRRKLGFGDSDRGEGGGAYPPNAVAHRRSSDAVLGNSGHSFLWSAANCG